MLGLVYGGFTVMLTSIYDHAVKLRPCYWIMAMLDPFMGGNRHAGLVYGGHGPDGLVH